MSRDIIEKMKHALVSSTCRTLPIFLGQSHMYQFGNRSACMEISIVEINTLYVYSIVTETLHEQVSVPLIRYP